ncbi:MAG TPA: DUF5106 domain-containing protein [Bacteroidales bacterium]|jgi:thiol-disulfide isomerase/thioredoxin|nr:DUF5106 domain-containing protein [Bacteroidales bacterium]HPS71501.1 DUF5106 domain-containing protein [Bacteroidales bacterium]
MKKIFFLILSLTVFSNLQAQNFKMSIISDFQADTISINSYNQGLYKYEKLFASPYSKELVFTSDSSLEPGIYLIKKDTTVIVEFFISSTKGQNFTIDFSSSDILFKGSPENKANQEYIKQMSAFDAQITQLNKEFQELKTRNLPNYMLQPFVDTIAMKAEAIQKQKKEYQLLTIERQKNTLLASLIQSTIEIPSPPKDYYSNKEKYYTYLLEHQFDYYKWEDDRLLNTPLPNNKYKFYAQVILELAPEVANPIVIKDLDKSKVSKAQYYQFFDYLEIFFGSLTSPYRDETLYIEMLKNALQYPQLSPERKARYEYELSVINKNLKGSLIPDFNILLNNGDSTSLYKISAEYLLIYFQNPDCPSCIELRQKMESMDFLKKAIADKKLTVLTVYFESNEQIWRNYLLKSANPAYIHSWNYDLSIEKDHLFDTRTIPMLILVDKDKRVIKKDLLKNEIEYYMKMINP